MDQSIYTDLVKKINSCNINDESRARLLGKYYELSGRNTEDLLVAVREDISYLELLLNDKIDYESDIFCYPYGFYDELSEATISSLGYKVTLTTEEGINYLEPGDDLIGLKRINVTMETDIKEYLD